METSSRNNNPLKDIGIANKLSNGAKESVSEHPNIKLKKINLVLEIISRILLFGKGAFFNIIVYNSIYNLYLLHILMKVINSIREIIDVYQLYIIDVYGVIINHHNIFLDSLKAINLLQEREKYVLILSNSPRPAQSLKDKLIEMSRFNYSQYINLIKNLTVLTSGEIFINFICQHYSNNEDLSFLKETAYIMSIHNVEHHYLVKEIVNRSNNQFHFTDNISRASYIIILAYTNVNEQNARSKFDYIFEKAISMKIPCICPNPDELIGQGSSLCKYAPGFYAKRYEKKYGGKVYYFGKPNKDIYHFGINHLPIDSKFNATKDNTLIIGDSIEHDIAGANAIGASSLLIGNTTANVSDYSMKFLSS